MVKAGCSLLGRSLFRIGMASELAAWALTKNRPPEASEFVSSAITDISQALAADYIVPADATVMRATIANYYQAIDGDNKELALDALAELTVKAYDVTFNKVLECEQRPGGEHG